MIRLAARAARLSSVNHLYTCLQFPHLRRPVLSRHAATAAAASMSAAAPPPVSASSTSASSSEGGEDDWRKSKIYTRTGDTGTTSLYNMQRKCKAEDFFQALGTVDEINSQLGSVQPDTPH